MEVMVDFGGKYHLISQNCPRLNARRQTPVMSPIGSLRSSFEVSVCSYCIFPCCNWADWAGSQLERDLCSVTFSYFSINNAYHSFWSYFGKHLYFKCCYQSNIWNILLAPSSFSQHNIFSLKYQWWFSLRCLYTAQTMFRSQGRASSAICKSSCGDRKRFLNKVVNIFILATNIDILTREPTENCFRSQPPEVSQETATFLSSALNSTQKLEWNMKTFCFLQYYMSCSAESIYGHRTTHGGQNLQGPSWIFQLRSLKSKFQL